MDSAIFEPTASRDLSKIRDCLHAALRSHIQIGEERFEAWFAGISVDHYDGMKLQLSVANCFLRTWIMKHHESVLANAVKEACNDTDTSFRLSARSFANRTVPEPKNVQLIAIESKPVQLPNEKSDEMQFVETTIAASVHSPMDAMLPILNVQQKRLRTPVILHIQRIVCSHFDVPIANMSPSLRTVKVLIPRQIAMYLSRKITELSFEIIGKSFKCHHSTVMNAVERVSTLAKTMPKMANTVQELEEKILTDRK